MRALLFFGLSVALVGCARGPNVSSAELPLRRVVVYRNGVGYFERAGTVNEDQVTFKMRQRMVGDFLASLAIVERGGSSVRAASFPLEIEKEDPNAPDPRFVRMLESWQTPDLPPGPKPSAADKLREVVLRLDGKEHDLAIGYVASTPVWRPSYRVVVQNGGADLQAWGIVQNLSGEDWTDVSLALVAGAPLAFESTLGTPVTPPRPIVTDSGEVIAAVPEGVTSLRETEDGPVDRVAPDEEKPVVVGNVDVADYDGSEGMEDEKTEKEASKKKPGAVRRASKGGGSGAMSGAPPPPPAAPTLAPAPAKPARMESSLRGGGISAPRKMSALAAVAVDTGTTRYEIPNKVTVPDESATMVLLINRRVPGEAVFLFAPDGGVPDSATHPFRVVRFTNDTPCLLYTSPSPRDS